MNILPTPSSHEEGMNKFIADIADGAATYSTRAVLKPSGPEVDVLPRTRKRLVLGEIVKRYKFFLIDHLKFFCIYYIISITWWIFVVSLSLIINWNKYKKNAMKRYYWVNNVHNIFKTVIKGYCHSITWLNPLPHRQITLRRYKCCCQI